MTRLFHLFSCSSISRWCSLSLWIVTCVVFSLASLSADTVLAEDTEWDPTWGYHQEEWYDPSDWFNDDSAVDYEDDYYGDYYDDNYYEDGYDGGYYDDDYYDYNYGYDGYYPPYDYYSEDWFDDEPDFDDWYG